MNSTQNTSINRSSFCSCDSFYSGGLSCKWGHSVEAHTWSSLRQLYWIAREASMVRKILGKCLFCCGKNASSGKQLIANLPEGRALSNNPYFFHTGMDMFGPLLCGKVAKQ